MTRRGLDAGGVLDTWLEPTSAELDTLGPDFMDPRRCAVVVDAWTP